MPPLYGPRASLYCTLYPLNILIFPLSILTGKWTLMTFFGSRSIAWIPSSSSRCSAAILGCSRALRKASAFFSGHASQVPLRTDFTVFQSRDFNGLFRSLGARAGPEAQAPHPPDSLREDVQGNPALAMV